MSPSCPPYLLNAVLPLPRNTICHEKNVPVYHNVLPDGALHLVAKLRGNEAAKRVAAYMEYDKWVPSAGLVITK